MLNPATTPTTIVVVDRDAHTRKKLASAATEVAPNTTIKSVSSWAAALRIADLLHVEAVIVGQPLDGNPSATAVAALSSAHPATKVIYSDGADVAQAMLTSNLAAQLGMQETTPPAVPLTSAARSGRRSWQTPSIIVVAVSTGGPDALDQVLRSLPRALRVPILVVQHMTAQFTPLLAARLDDMCELSVSEATAGEPITAGHVYLAPGGRHMKVQQNTGGPVIELSDEDPVNFCRPSADVLFNSAVGVYSHSVLAVVMTGMGRDGADGSQAIVDAGGYLIAQDPDTAAIASMPAAVASFADEVVPLNDIGTRLAEIATLR